VLWIDPGADELSVPLDGLEVLVLRVRVSQFCEALLELLQGLSVAFALGDEGGESFAVVSDTTHSGVDNASAHCCAVRADTPTSRSPTRAGLAITSNPSARATQRISLERVD
jgi:hypothetical protein